MSCRCDDVTVLEWIAHQLRSDEATDMRNISHQVGSDAVSDLTISGVIKVSRVPTCTTEKHLRLEFKHGGCKCVHVDNTSLLVDIVWLTDKVMA